MRTDEKLKNSSAWSARKVSSATECCRSHRDAVETHFAETTTNLCIRTVHAPQFRLGRAPFVVGGRSWTRWNSEYATRPEKGLGARAIAGVSGATRKLRMRGISFAMMKQGKVVGR